MKEGFQNYFAIVFGLNMCLLYVNERDILFLLGSSAPHCVSRCGIHRKWSSSEDPGQTKKLFFTGGFQTSQEVYI